MRHVFDLTEATRKVFTPHVQRIAEEAEVTDKYIHGILSGDKTDPFAPFEHYYTASVRAKAPVCHYDQRLAAIRARYQPATTKLTEMECLADKIKGDASTTSEMVAALTDGEIDVREAGKILIAINAERKILDKIEGLLNHKQGSALKAV